MQATLLYAKPELGIASHKHVPVYNLPLKCSAIRSTHPVDRRSHRRYSEENIHRSQLSAVELMASHGTKRSLGASPRRSRLFGAGFALDRGRPGAVRWFEQINLMRIVNDASTNRGMWRLVQMVRPNP
ncbi:hypothetical protein Mapa_002063 [Marchantia paleacea]|nr:hypothetical protein Mapa_002063 [Marchantia paleacea]